jgi:hypothetical protein
MNKYNIFIRTQSIIDNILDIDDLEVGVVIDSYNYGKDSFFLNGKKYWLKDLFEIQIFTFDNEKIKTIDQLEHFCKHEMLMRTGYSRREKWIPKEILSEVGKNITSSFIKTEYGILKHNRVDNSIIDNFVDKQRILELRNIHNNDFDFTKLIAFLEELNLAYQNKMFLSIPMLVRAIIDHVPPLFGKTTFLEVAGSHGSKSFKENMSHLEKSNRKIADSLLHTQIRQKENLPTEVQINFKNDIDVLLQEIIRINLK